MQTFDEINYSCLPLDELLKKNISYSKKATDVSYIVFQKSFKSIIPFSLQH